ncbi:MAG: DUF3379 family protein, partial [Thiohalocapsa sp.]
DARADLTEIAVEHVRNEPWLLQEEDGPPLSTAAVLLLLQSLGAGHAISLNRNTPVRYAGRCLIRRSMGAHLVMDGQRGPVTALVMPQGEVDSSGFAQGRQYDTLIMPAPDAGVALVGLPGEPLEALAAQLGLR